MRKISGNVVSSKPVSLSRAAKLMIRFAAVDNGSSPAVSIYLQRTAEALNQLVQRQDKSKRSTKSENSSQRDDKGEDSEIEVKRVHKKNRDAGSETIVADGDHEKSKKKKKKKRVSDGGDELKGEKKRKRSRSDS